MKTLKFMLMLAATVAAGAVRAEVDSYLYWMVSSDMKYVWEAPDKPGTPVTYDYAKISADGGDTWRTDIVLWDEGVCDDLGYPSTVELPDGSLLTVFYAKDAEDGPAVLKQIHWKLKERG
jgi:hypothetical protein